MPYLSDYNLLKVKLMSIYFICVVFLMSCKHVASKNTAMAGVKSASIKQSVNVQKTYDTLAIPEDTIPKITIPEGIIQVGEDKPDSTSKVKLLETCDLNGNENISPKDAKLDWKGIFYNKGDFYIKPTKIKFIKEHSEFDDNNTPDQMTGWRIKTSVTDTCSELISGVNDLISGPVKPIKIDNFYYAGQKQEFNYEGVTYTLYTTGTKRNGKINNFKIFLMATIKGHAFNQLIRSLGNDVPLNGGGDSVNTLSIGSFGDIDGDKIPDFFVSDGGYAFGSTSLYLSKPAGDKAILKLVAFFAQSD